MVTQVAQETQDCLVIKVKFSVYAMCMKYSRNKIFIVGQVVHNSSETDSLYTAARTVVASGDMALN